MMLINGKPGELISALDRGLLYGDGLFETIRVINGLPVLWSAHLGRLLRGCEFLQIAVQRQDIVQDFKALIHGRAAYNGIVKIIITRGIGGRGYRPGTESGCTRILQLHTATGVMRTMPGEGISVQMCRHTLSESSSAGIKHLNRLDQVMGASELTGEFEEGLMLNRDENVIEGTRSNLFLATGNTLVTPDLASCGVAGVMRDFLLDFFRRSGKPVQVTRVTRPMLKHADEIMVCNSVSGVHPVTVVQDGSQTWSYPVGPAGRLAQTVALEQLAETPI